MTARGFFIVCLVAVFIGMNIGFVVTFRENQIIADMNRWAR